MKIKKIALLFLLLLITLFVCIHLYFFDKYKGNITVLVCIEYPIKEYMDIRVLIDNQVVIQHTVDQNSYYIAGKNKFVSPGKHTITIESKERALKKEYDINVYFFKDIRISYYPPLSYDEEEYEEERFEVYENWIPMYVL
jgi:hypothetical protein